MNNHTSHDLASLLKIDQLPESQREEVLERVGGIVVTASVGALLQTLSDEQVKKLEEYLGHASDEDDLFAYLLRTYPEFQPIVEREIKALNEQATATVKQ